MRIAIVTHNQLLVAGLQSLFQAKHRVSMVSPENCSKPEGDAIVIDGDGIHCPLELVVSQVGRPALLLTSDSEDLTRVQLAIRTGMTGALLAQASLEEFELAVRLVASGKCYLSPAFHGALWPEVEQDRRYRPAGAEGLTIRETQLLVALAKGKTAKAIAAEWGVSTKTADAHRQNLYKKLNIHNRTDLIRHAVAYGLVDIERKVAVNS